MPRTQQSWRAITTSIATAMCHRFVNSVHGALCRQWRAMPWHIVAWHVVAWHVVACRGGLLHDLLLQTVLLKLDACSVFARASPCLGRCLACCGSCGFTGTRPIQTCEKNTTPRTQRSWRAPGPSIGTMRGQATFVDSTWGAKCRPSELRSLSKFSRLAGRFLACQW